MLRISGASAESCKKRVLPGAHSETTEPYDDGVAMVVEKNKEDEGEKGPVSNNEGIRKKKRNQEKGKMVVFVSNKAKEGARTSKPCSDQDALEELARKYQKQMKILPIPKARLGEAEAENWVSLFKTIKCMYGQPLHYLTLMLCESWDKVRCGSEDEGKRLDSIIDWKNAENTIWTVEQFHRLCSSSDYLAMLWSRDPHFGAFVDEVIPPP